MSTRAIPATWGDDYSWRQNMVRLREWACDAAHFSRISREDYEHYQRRLAHNIQSADVRAAVLRSGPAFGHLLPWIHSGIALVNECSHVRKECMLVAVASLPSFETTWRDHVDGNYQTTEELGALSVVLLSVADDVTQKLDAFDRATESDDYSSYSDYSEEDTASESSDAEEEGE